MTIFNIISLFGGLALFLYGMRIMGNGLKQGSSGVLKKALEKVWVQLKLRYGITTLSEILG